MLVMSDVPERCIPVMISNCDIVSPGRICFAKSMYTPQADSIGDKRVPPYKLIQDLFFSNAFSAIRHGFALVQRRAQGLGILLGFAEPRLALIKRGSQRAGVVFGLLELGLALLKRGLQTA